MRVLSDICDIESISLKSSRILVKYGGLDSLFDWHFIGGDFRYNFQSMAHNIPFSWGLECIHMPSIGQPLSAMQQIMAL